MSAYKESCCALVVTLTFWQRRSEKQSTPSPTLEFQGNASRYNYPSKSTQHLFQKLAICFRNGNGKYPCKVTKGGWSCINCLYILCCLACQPICMPSMSPYFMFKHMRLITNIHDNFAVATQKNNNVIGHTLLSPLKLQVNQKYGKHS